MILRRVCMILVFFASTCHIALAGQQVYLPNTPASIPVILALEKIPQLEAQLYVNHSQANALFLRGDATMLLTGLAVGRKFYEQGVPLAIVSSHVVGMSYLVSAKGVAPVSSFKSLMGKKLWLPFPGSPLEEICLYFANQDGLKLGVDIEVGYTSFIAMVQLLERGKIEYALLPEPFVSVAESKGSIDVQLSLMELWNGESKEGKGYPQVALLAKQAWLRDNPELTQKFISSLVESVEYVQENPQGAVRKTHHLFSFGEEVLLNSLLRTEFTVLYGEPLKSSLKSYYHKIDKQLGADFDAVY